MGAAPGRRDHGAVEPPPRRENPRRVEKHELRAALHRDAAQQRARGLHLGRDDRDLAADQRIDQRRFAGVGRADQRDEAAARGRPVSASSTIGAIRLHALALEHGGGRRLLGRALGAAEPFGRLPARQHRPPRETPDRDAGRCARPRGRSASAGRAPAPIPAGWSSDRAAAAPARACARPRASRRAWPPRHSRRRDKPRRPAPRTRRPGSRCASARRRWPPKRRAAAPRRDRSRAPRRRRLRGEQIGEPPRQFALVGLGKGAKQHVGDDQPEHVVAQELEPLIAVGAAAAGDRRDVGERAVEQIAVLEAVADGLFQRAGRGAARLRATAPRGAAAGFLASARRRRRARSSAAPVSERLAVWLRARLIARS